MSNVQDAVVTVPLPRQAEAPSAPAPAAEPPALIGKDRPYTSEERAFAFGVFAMFFVLWAVIVVELLLARYVWV